jgi:regulator of cell morphogenesis and NO signaling
MGIAGPTRVGDILEERPGARRILEKLGADGTAYRDRPLAELCAEKGLSLAEVVRALENHADRIEASGDRPWKDLGNAELTQYIEEVHHGYTRQELARLDQLLRRILDAGGKDAASAERIRTHFERLNYDLESHMEAEEQGLFPAIRAMKDGGSAPQDLASAEQLYFTIRDEHVSAEELIINIALATKDYVAPEGSGPALKALWLGLRDLEDDLHRHIYLENNVLFPRVALQDKGSA